MMSSVEVRTFCPAEPWNSAVAIRARRTGLMAVSLSRYTRARWSTSACEGVSETNRIASFRAIRRAVSGWWAR